MKRNILVLLTFLLVGALAGCNNGGPADAPQLETPVEESRAESSVAESSRGELERAVSQAELDLTDELPGEPPVEPEEEPEPQPVSDDPPQPASSPYPDALLTVYIVDEAGNPVPGVGGLVELGVATYETFPDGTAAAASSPGATPLTGTGAQHLCTGADGGLYLTTVEALPEAGALQLYAYYDSDITMKIPMQFAKLSGPVTVTWTGGPPPASPPDLSLRRITFHIVDRQGNSVPYLSGNLEQIDGASASSRSLQARSYDPYESGQQNFDPQDMMMSDQTGILYLELEKGWENHKPDRGYRLHLYAYFDSTIRQEYYVELPDPPASYTVTWEQGPPPTQRPPQTDGIRLFLVDPQGNPVQGVSLGGSPYPRPGPGEMVPGIAMVLDPSDQQGYVRWESVGPGIYDLSGYKDGASQKFEIVMPENQVMVDIVLVWNPQ